MAYAVAYQAVTGTDSTESLSALSFDYLKKTHLEVRMSTAGESLSDFKDRLSTTTVSALAYPSQYTLNTSKVLTFATATLANGSVYQIEIKRVSDISNAYVDFTDGSTVTEANLDDASTQERYLIQELDDTVAKIREDGKTVVATTGNAAPATALETARTISISGDVTYASPAFDGTANVTAAGTVTQVQGQAISASTPTEGQVWKYTGSTWTPSANTAASAITVKEEGSSITAAVASIDFVGGSVTATNSGDAVTITITDSDTTYSAATTSALGLIKLEDAATQTTAASAVTTTAARTYGLQINSSGQGVVNVPWVDTNTTYSITDGELSQNNFTNTDHSKLNAIEASADVTDAINVAAAGAGMLGVIGAWTLPQRTALLTDADGNFDLNAKQNFSCTPGTAVALTFTNPADGQSGFVKLINAGAYVHTAHANTKIHADDLTAIGAAGTFLLSYLSDGTNTWVTVSKALA